MILSSCAPSLGPVYELCKPKEAYLERRKAFWPSTQLLIFGHQAGKMYSQEMQHGTIEPVTPEGIATHHQEACTAMPQQVLWKGVAWDLLCLDTSYEIDRKYIVVSCLIMSMIGLDTDLWYKWKANMKMMVVQSFIDNRLCHFVLSPFCIPLQKIINHKQSLQHVDSPSWNWDDAVPKQGIVSKRHTKPPESHLRIWNVCVL